MFRKVLVANRGEIAIRAFRAAYELGAGTVAVFPHEDRNSLHRLKADESYEIGEPGHPVRAYLSVDEIIGAARKAGADAIYPGYGFLSENPDLAEACERAGITFVGPSHQILQMTGNKATAVAAAREAGVPVLAELDPDQVAETDLPVLIKASAGGGGRGMRVVRALSELPEQLAAARRLAPEQAAAQAQHMLLLNTGLAVLFAAAYAVLGLLVLKQRAWARIAVTGVLAVQLAMAMGSLSLSAVNLIVLVLGGAAAWCCWTRSAAEWVSGEHE